MTNIHPPTTKVHVKHPPGTTKVHVKHPPGATKVPVTNTSLEQQHFSDKHLPGTTTFQ